MLTARDHFAMAALQGCLAYSHHNEQWGDYHNNGSHESLAVYCYKIADAMMGERAKASTGSDSSTFSEGK